jgi:hypothetical protein
MAAESTRLARRERADSGVQAPGVRPHVDHATELATRTAVAFRKHPRPDSVASTA